MRTVPCIKIYIFPSSQDRDRQERAEKIVSVVIFKNKINTEFNFHGKLLGSLQVGECKQQWRGAARVRRVQRHRH